MSGLTAGLRRLLGVSKEPKPGETIPDGNSAPGTTPPPPSEPSRWLEFQPDALDRMRGMAGQLVGALEGRLGRTARPALSFYGYRVATAALQHLRFNVLRGESLTDAGEEWVACVAAYLALIATSEWGSHPGVELRAGVRYVPGALDNEVVLAASRVRDGQEEAYAHDFLLDVRRLLLSPPRPFPVLHGKHYLLESLSMPSPESLYLYGVSLMQSPASLGTWPRGQRPGGLDEDFQRARERLVSDLHGDCEIPESDPVLRQLSWWVVFPPYGWEMNEGQGYNLMTLVDQVSGKKLVPMEDAIAYLRALLKSQGPEIRMLGARALMVYRVPPRDATEALHYSLALNAPDAAEAARAAAKLQARVEGIEPSAAWWAEIERERRQWVDGFLLPGEARSLAEADPELRRISELSPGHAVERLQGLDLLRQRYPDDWLLDVWQAAERMGGPDPLEGEARLREIVRDPLGFEAHGRLGTLLLGQGRRQESLAVYEDAVKRWPWNQQAVDACTWLVTEGMVRA